MCEKVKIVTILTVVTIVSIFFTNISQGQEKAPTAKEEAGIGYYLTLGMSIIDIKDLNAKLESKGYGKSSDNFPSVGGGGYRIINNRLIIGGEGHLLFGEEVASGNYKNSIEIGYGFFNLRYLVYPIKDLRVYPLLGLGGGVMYLKIVEKVTSLSFDDVLDNPKGNVELSTGCLLLDLAFGIDCLLLEETKKGKGGMILGLRAGYILSLYKLGWDMDEIKISGAPEIGITGPYIHLMIGAEFTEFRGQAEN